ncbi:unnamed protein product [Amoebophrya sp. A25]|nr:unnamed protein product [Amoebophrya sp. A25]|eukprot:GSA25T00014382001.1
MCLGGIEHAGFRRMFVGVDRVTGAKIGFDDRAFYDEIDGAKKFLKRASQLQSGEWQGQFLKIAASLQANELGKLKGDEKNAAEGRSEISMLQRLYDNHMAPAASTPSTKAVPEFCVVVHQPTWKLAGLPVAPSSFDPTGSVVAKAVEAACRSLDRYDLSDCIAYSFVAGGVQQDHMSIALLLWARIPSLTVVVPTINMAAPSSSTTTSLQKVKQARKDGVLAEECAEVFRLWRRIAGIVYYEKL